MEQFKKITNEYRNTITNFKSNFVYAFNKYPKKLTIIVCIWLVAFLALVFGIIKLNTIAFNSVQTIDSEAVYATDNLALLSADLPPVGASSNIYINMLELAFDATSTVYNNFISYTPDPTGKASCEANSTNCTVRAHQSDFLSFPSTNAQISSTKTLTNTLLGLFIPIAIILLSMQFFNEIIGGDGQKLKPLLYRSLGMIFLMLITPFIISYSIVFANQLSMALLNNTSLTGFIHTFIANLENSQSNDPFQNLLKSFMALGSNDITSPLSFIYALPILLTMGSVLMLLMFISFQFVLRFLNLYFLATVYPVVIVFGMHPATAGMVSNYWKQWTTFLVQQPVFILGFVSINNVLANLFINGVSFEGIIIFIGMLVFLGSINIIAAKLWGDMYTAVSQNVTAAIAANEMKQNFVDKPVAAATQLVSMGAKSLIGKVPDGLFSSDLTSTASEAAKGNQAHDKAKSLGVKSDESLLTKELRGNGYDVQNKGQGKLGVSGDFYTNSNGSGNTSTLYTSRDDAIKDGVTPKNIQQVKLDNLSIQDTSNKKMMNRYNDQISKQAAANNGHAGNIGLGFKSPDTKVLKNMDIGRSYNLRNQVQGIGVRNDAINGDRSINGDNIIKLHVYKSVINNKSK